jgi:hypothetical protein
LLEAIKPDTGDGGTGTGKPRESLRSGASNEEEPDEMDPLKLAAQVPRL